MALGYESQRYKKRKVIVLAEVILKANHVSKVYGNFEALKSVDLKVQRGDILGIVGDNGAGKSTLFKLFTGLAFATSGEITLYGEHNPKDFRPKLRRSGSIIEQPGFFPQLSIEKNLEYYRILKGVPGKEAVIKALETVNLTHAKNRKAKTLSMGMKQRLGLAIALLGEPDILILDEPINGLDPSGIIEMRNLFLKLNHEKNITLLISSHNLPELEQLATVYAFMDRGKLLEQVSTKQLRERCQDYIDIALSDPKYFTVLLEQQLGITTYQVLPDNTIRIINPAYASEQFSGLASKYGLEIYKLEHRKVALAHYFLELKKRSVM